MFSRSTGGVRPFAISVGLAIGVLAGVAGLGCSVDTRGQTAVGAGDGGPGGGGAGGGAATDAPAGSSPGNGGAGGTAGRGGDGGPSTCEPGKGRSLGARCGCNEECGSGFCVDGVCCNLACTGACVSCNQPESMGECAPAAAGVPDPHGVCKKEAAESCGQDGTCNGLGGCRKYPPGTTCRPASCLEGSLVAASSCDGLGVCLPGTAINCAPSMCKDNACMVTCASTADCAPPNQCVNGSCGLRGLGQPCMTGGQCKSGFCADGVCCDNACTGKCMSCALPPSLGRCVAVAEDAPDPRVAAGVTDASRICADQGASSCGTNGRCDGAGGCQRYPAGTVCRAQSCDASSQRFTARGVCRGGSCEVPAPVACAPYRCDGTRCAASCERNDQCAGSNLCLDGSCGKKSQGSLCARNDECASGFCAQGVCCNERCNGTCQACNRSGSMGTCSNVSAGAADPQGGCRDEGAASCGHDGTCNGNGGCRRYAAGTVCAPQRCANGMRTTASTCNGSGSCRPGSSVACAPYVCNSAGTNCLNACTGSGSAAQCAPPNNCLGGRCGLVGRGGSCDETAECQSGLTCVEGVCCDRACGGPCQSCKLPASLGTCTAVGCTPSATQSCGMGGTQSCSSSCQWGPCMGQTCSGPSSQTCGNCGTRTRTCNNGTWSAWSACSGEGACSVGSNQSCGMGGTQSCSSSCQWGPCMGQNCTGSATRACGNCGMQTRTCVNGQWSEWGACMGQGACAPGANRSCGMGGTQTCTMTCQWGTCTGQECSGPAMQACGNCGTQSRTCNNGQWSEWGACMGQGACSPGASRSCGMGGTQSCTMACQWGTCTGQGCAGPATRACGNCGTQSRTCNNGQWSDWGACTGQGECAADSTGACGNGGMRTCSNRCQWGPCREPPPTQCMGPAMQDCGNCGRQRRQCMNGTWGPWGECTGQGECTPGDTMPCANGRMKTCTNQCRWPNGCPNNQGDLLDPVEPISLP